MPSLPVKKENLIEKEENCQVGSQPESIIVHDHNYCKTKKSAGRVSKSNRGYQLIPNEQRKQIIDAVDSGQMSFKEAAKNFNVKYFSVARIYREFNKFNKTLSEKRGGTKKKKLDESEVKFLQELILQDCTITLKSIQAVVRDKFQKYICIASLCKYIKGVHCQFKILHSRTETEEKADL